MSETPQWYRDILAEAGMSPVTELICKVIVNGEEIAVRQLVDSTAYARPEVRAQVDEGIRHALVMEILKKWQPKISSRT